MEANEIRISAALAHDVKFRVLPSDHPVANFFLTISGNGKRPDAIQAVTAWGEVAEVCRNLRAGDRVYVEGELVSDAWLRDESVIPRTAIRAANVKILTNPPANDFAGY